VTLREVSFVSGNVTLLELVALARLVRLKAPLTVFEIGTFDGRTTLNLAANAPDSALVHTLDLPMGDEHATAYVLEDAERAYVRKPQSGGRVHRSDLARKVKQHYGDSATFDFAPFVRDGVDFIFVDGSHAYEYARSDSLAAMSMLREGRGTIVWHDYNGWRGVSEALHELRRDDARFAGVRWIEGTSLALLER
jgi:predicted O-methyltransferase YrrM